jgi:outer membrane protein OmpA-like peptidoglycan-associated protein
LEEAGVLGTAAVVATASLVLTLVDGFGLWRPSGEGSRAVVATSEIAREDMNRSAGTGWQQGARLAQRPLIDPNNPGGPQYRADPQNREPTADQIIDALRPREQTKSVSPDPFAEKARNADDQRFLDGLRTGRTRRLSAAERERVAALAKGKPSIDLAINFDDNAATISRATLPAVTALGKALSGPALKGSVFLVAGHTDAKGGAEYNQNLSERRAETIRTYLSQMFGIPAENLLAVGYGRNPLKPADDPLAEDRGVLVVNMGSAQEAGRR